MSKVLNKILTSADVDVENGVTGKAAYDAHVIGKGNDKHIPSAGSVGQYLKHDGTWGTPPDTNTTYSAGSGLSLSGTTFSHAEHTGDVTGSTELTIGANKVTLAKMQKIGQGLLGNTREESSDDIGIITFAAIKTALALTKADVGLSNVDNTSDNAKPISSATQSALNAKTTFAEVTNNTFPDASLYGNGTILMYRKTINDKYIPYVCCDSGSAQG